MQIMAVCWILQIYLLTKLYHLNWPEELGQYCDKAAGWMNDTGFKSRQGKEFCLHLNYVQTSSGTQPASYSMGNWGQGGREFKLITRLLVSG